MPLPTQPPAAGARQSLVCWMLLVHAAAFVVGVVFAASSGATSLSFVALAGPLLLVATYGAWRRRLVVGLLGPLGLVWLAAGVLSWQSTQSRPASACKLERYLGQFRARRLAVELRSPLRSSPQGGWQFARALWVQQGKAVYPACGRIIVYHARQAGNEHLSSGRRFLLHGTLRAVSPAPRQAGCNRLGYPTTDARFYVRPGGAVPLDPVRVGLLDSLRERLRREIASACGASSHTGAVLRALVLGERSGLVSDRRRIYATAGTESSPGSQWPSPVARRGPAVRAHASCSAAFLLGSGAMAPRRLGEPGGDRGRDRLLHANRVGTVDRARLRDGVRHFRRKAGGATARLHSAVGARLRPAAGRQPAPAISPGLSALLYGGRWHSPWRHGTPWRGVGCPLWRSGVPCLPSGS
jgi:hypothetical protein